MQILLTLLATIACLNGLLRDGVNETCLCQFCSLQSTVRTSICRAVVGLTLLPANLYCLERIINIFFNFSKYEELGHHPQPSNVFGKPRSLNLFTILNNLVF